MADPVRLNKALAQAGVCSRRKADEFIAAGRVTVDGEPAEPGLKIDPSRATVALDGKPLALGREKKTYVLLNKPVQVVSTAKDPEGRRTVLDLLPRELRTVRLYPVGRLDYFSEGLLLLTSDGELTHRVTHPRHHLAKEYEVVVRGDVSKAQLAAMRGGMTLAEGDKLAPVEAEVTAVEAGNAKLRLVLRQGVNRQIRRMCRDMGLTIMRLRRTRLGPLTLGKLPPGEARRLTSEEVSRLRQAVGLQSR
jgi:23S rRNA pseudouridine2605 synthase